MAHGNFSDIAALLLVALAVQHVWYSETLATDYGPIKANYAKISPGLQWASKFAGGLLLVLALTLSGVKWNPANGKMAGLGCFICAGCTAYSTHKMDAGVFLLRQIYITVAVIAAAGVHIFLFPSNKIPRKTEATKNNHGNFSDLAFLIMLGCAVVMMAFQSTDIPLLGSIRNAMFDETSSEMIKFCGSLLLIVGLMLSGIKWNPVNGKMAGLGLFLCTALLCTQTDLSSTPRTFLLATGIIATAGVHVFLFPSNPLPPKEDASKRTN